MPEKSDKHESRRICENVLARVHSGITREATLSEGRKGWPTGRPDEKPDSSPEELTLAYTGEEGK
jgi:hypothetical protein